MLNSYYIEDIFLEFYNLVLLGKVQPQWQDEAPINSFWSAINNGKTLTKKQSDYILRLLTKYSNSAASADLDYKIALDDPKWKQTFRVIDTSKKIFVEETDEGLQICMKFPYDLKKNFDLEFADLMNLTTHKTWDNERKLRVFPLYTVNLMRLSDFVDRYDFDIDDTFSDVIANTEEAWNQQDNIIPSSKVIDGEVVLVNANEDAEEFWNNNKVGNIADDLLLAKSMCYPLAEKYDNNESLIEKASISKNNMFWIEQHAQFFEIYKQLTKGSVCVILDRQSDTQRWIRDFVLTAVEKNIPKDDIKVCFRESKSKDESPFNQWVHREGLAGKVDTGRIFIFENKPAKWLFSKEIDVKIVLTNNLYPSANTLTQQWMESHSFVLHMGAHKPSVKRNKSIVEL